MEAARIIERLEQHLPKILEQRPVLAAYVHGSVVKGCFRPTSDIDVALVLNPDHPLTAYQRLQLELQIETEIEESCNIPRADVRSIDHAPLRVQGQILTQGKLLYSGDEEARVAHEVQIRKRYFDFEPVLKRMQKAYFARLTTAEEGEAIHG